MAFEKTWTTSWNDSLFTDSDMWVRYKHWAFWIKDSLTRSSVPQSGRWTVVGSSDGATGGMDGVDRWGGTFDVSKFVVGNDHGSAHSWVALKSPDGLGPVYLTLTFNRVGYNPSFNVLYTHTLPTGGSETDDPVLTDYHVAVPESVSYYRTSMRAHIAIAADGSFFQATSSDGDEYFSSYLCVTNLVETRSGDTSCKTVFSYKQDVNYGGITNTQAWGGFNNAGAPIVCGLVVPWVGDTLVLHATMDMVENKYLDWPVYLYVTSPGQTSIKGRIPDIRFALGNLPNGATQPNSGAVVATVVGNTLWVPANVTPVL